MSHTRAPRRHAPLAEKRSLGRTLTLLLVAILLIIPSFTFATLQGWIPIPIVNAITRVFVWRQEGAVPWSTDQPVNVLVMGVQVGGVSTNPLTDSIIVASYQPQDGSVKLLSIPRDLWVEIPGYGGARINEAFQIGGPYEAMLTVQQNLGIPVNYYAVVNYRAVETLIDHLGGVTVEVPEDIDDPYFPAEDEIHYEPFSITKGVHHLNGREALRYARTRHGDSDFGRAARQQQVVMALKDRLLNPLNLLKAPLFMHDARSLIKTNFPVDQAPGLMAKVLQSSPDSIQRAVLSYDNGAVVPFTGENGASLLILNPPVANQIIEEFFGPSLALLRNAPTIQVDNGNGYAGSATHFAQVLAGMGATVGEAGNADSMEYTSHQVLYTGRDRSTVQSARLIAAMLGTTAERAGGSQDAAIRVILGKNYAPWAEFTSDDWDRFLPPQ